jgi:hypothetical protein
MATTSAWRAPLVVHDVRVTKKPRSWLGARSALQIYFYSKIVTPLAEEEEEEEGGKK